MKDTFLGWDAQDLWVSSYLANLSLAAIRIQTEEPDCSNLVWNECDWERATHKGAREVKDKKTPSSKAQWVTTTTDK